MLLQSSRPVMIEEQLWVGRVEMKPLDRVTYGAAGAFTNLVTWAFDMDSFRAKADEIASTLGLYVFDVEEVEPLAERCRKHEITPDLEDMVLRAEGNRSAIVYGTFHRYPFDDA